jgi:hypothetical protein
MCGVRWSCADREIFSAKMKAFACCTVVAVALMASLPMFAHHGAAAYDTQKSLTLNATVTSLDWTSPHCVLHFDAKNSKGEVLNWSLEMYNPLWMTRAGWKRTSLKSGDQITVTFHASKNGAPTGYIRDGDGKITFAGKELGFHQLGDERGPGEQ